MALDKNPILEQLIKDSINLDNKIEIDISQTTVSRLKQTRLGIFQNEIDYRFLLKDFIPLKTNTRSSVDILGFMGDSFNLVELKLFDEEKPKSYHHWSALYHLKNDIEKLEHASTFKSNHLLDYYFVFAVRNSERKLNHEQLEVATKYIDSVNRKPRVRTFNQFTVLKTIEKLNKIKWPHWSFEFQHKEGVSFLLGKLIK